MSATDTSSRQGTSLKLLGQPTLQEYIHFITEQVVDGDARSRRSVVDEWREVNDIYGELEQSEAGIADSIEVSPLDEALLARAAEIRDRPDFRFTFDRLPTEIVMVELEKLVVWQTRIDADFAEGLQAGLHASMDAAAILDFSLPPPSPADSISVRKLGSNRFQFMSDSSDFRPHAPTLLDADQVSGFETFGPLWKMVGLGVGFGSNYLCAIRSEQRLLLHNGHHRAHALLASGIRHAPCVVQSVTRRDELEIAAKRQVLDDPDFYFGAARPPLLKDYFDPRIVRRMPTWRSQKVIEIGFETREIMVAKA
ncbi:MAG: hypothetical protein CSB44_08825 [Gammaproteobacteria bacterium]|nr:MAG: hypothetical protein CSB44_08825 [Gammaproteobacteria bacterium]